jgi:hypothetical protein
MQGKKSAITKLPSAGIRQRTQLTAVGGDARLKLARGRSNHENTEISLSGKKNIPDA